MDPRHPKICISFSPAFEKIADDLASKYRFLGAQVTTARETVDNKLRNFKGWLCYFSNDTISSSIATSLAKDVAKIQKTKPRFISLNEHRVDFMIYLVGSDPPSQKAEACIVPDLISCPQCNVLLRPNRIQRHKKKVHGIGSAGRKRSVSLSTPHRPVPRKPLRRLLFVSNPMIHETPSGAPGRLGWSAPRIKLLKPRNGTSQCRICGSFLSMYNGSECYGCNPK